MIKAAEFVYKIMVGKKYNPTNNITNYEQESSP